MRFQPDESRFLSMSTPNPKSKMVNPYGGSLVLNPSQNAPLAELFSLLNTLSFKRGDFTLASGAKSDWYMDCRMTALSARGSFLIGKLLNQTLKREALPIHSVGGMVLGAAPLVSAVTVASAASGHGIEGFLVRKEAKGHGGGKQIEGHLAPNDRIVLVEDVVTTGGSTLRAIEVIRKQYPSVNIAGVYALVDREAGAREKFTAVGVPLHTLFSIESFLDNL
jgi:orotate phosphoribosyltransferase